MTAADPRPLARALPYVDPAAAVAAFAPAEGTVWLDSALVTGELGRYSFLAVDPYLRVRPDGGDPFDALARTLARTPPFEPHAGLPPFQGGLAGSFGYELGRHLERVPVPPAEAPFPELLIGAYDLVVAWDHVEGETWVFSSGLPLKGGAARRARARDRMAYAQACLRDAGPLPPPSAAPRPPVRLHSNFTRARYEGAVGRIVDAILSGDVFQVNLSQRFTAPLAEAPFELYRRLRASNPAPFAAWLDFGDVVVASASPERFLRLSDRRVDTCPIKGTRPRSSEPQVDEQLALALLASEKDRAENVMIVDLLRNDLSRVCEDGTVDVEALCELQSFATVHHLVSTVSGELRERLGPVDLLRATFPGGSITGAPKIRAMEWIAELEGVRRGPYCGAVGYVGFDGGMDTSIAIRTYAIRDGAVTFHAGGGIVADSDPAAEYVETLDKARALVSALGAEPRDAAR